MSEQPNPGWRVDVLVERVTDRALKQFVEKHPLIERLKQQVGLDLGDIVRAQVSHHLKREKITDMKSLRRALRR